jgi:hypothetical protein
MTSKVYSYIALVLIGLFSIAYSVYTRNFAEMHLSLPFLNFPVFVGEILLAVCLVLFVLYCHSEKISLGKWGMWVGIYLAFVVLKALKGYHDYGPLAFRNAALFYYPLFGVMGYVLFDRAYFSRKVMMFLLAVMLLVMVVYKSLGYFNFTYFFLSLILILRVKNPWRMMLLVALVFIFPPSFLFKGGRSYSVGTYLALLFLTWSLVFIFLKGKRIWQVLTVVAMAAFFFTGVALFANKNKLKSMFSPEKVITCIVSAEQSVADKKATFQFKPIAAQVYNPEKETLAQIIQADPSDRVLDQSLIDTFYKVRTSLNVELNEEYQAKIEKEFKDLKEQLAGILKTANNEIKAKGTGFESVTIKEAKVKAVDVFHDAKLKLVKLLEQFCKSQNTCLESLNSSLDTNYLLLEKGFDINLESLRQYRNLDIEYQNMLFRWSIWHDMVDDLVEGKAVFGVSFGKPQRSKRIEILKLAWGEWNRDGWIAPHNSYLHYIYRGGVVGLAFISVVFYLFWLLVGKCIQTRSLTLTFLTAIVLYWLTIANFLITFELPYNAIPFWTFFGMVLAYVYKPQVRT